MFLAKVYQRRGSGFQNRMENKELQTECLWVPETPPAKPAPTRNCGEKSGLSFPEEKGSSTGKKKQSDKCIGLIDLNKNIYEINELNKGIDDRETQLTGNFLESVNLTQQQGEEVVDVQENEPDSVNSVFVEYNLLPDSTVVNNGENLESVAISPESCVNFVLGSNLAPSSNLGNDVNNPKNLQNDANSPESCLSQNVQKNAPDEVLSLSGDGNLRSQPENRDKKKPGRKPKPKRKKHRPRVLVVEGKPKKTPQPRTPKKTPQPKTPMPANESNRKRKRASESTKGRKQKSDEEYWLSISGDVADQSTSKKRRCVRENRKNNSEEIIAIAPAPVYTFRPRRARRALNFNDLDFIFDDDNLSNPIQALTFDNLLICHRKKKTRMKRRMRLNVLFMRDLLGLELPKRKKRCRRASKRCNLGLLTGIPICSQLPKLPSKQEFGNPSSIQQPQMIPESDIPSSIQQLQNPESSIPICIQRTQIQESGIPLCIQKPQLPSLQEFGIPICNQLSMPKVFKQQTQIQESDIPLCIQKPQLPSLQQFGIPICNQLSIPKVFKQEPEKSVVEYDNFSLSLLLPQERMWSQEFFDVSEPFPEVRGMELPFFAGMPPLEFKNFFPYHRMNLEHGFASQEFITDLNSQLQFIPDPNLPSAPTARQEENNKALVIRHGVLSNGSAAVVSYQPPGDTKKRAKVDRVTAKVDLDPETMRMWNLIMKIDDGTATDDLKRDEQKENWWQKERKVFEGRIHSFISRMTTFLGDRRFKSWKGSVVDSVIGVYLTQNVSDNLSSNAYMSLAAKFPVKSTSNYPASNEIPRMGYGQEPTGSNMISLEGTVYFVTEPDPDPDPVSNDTMKCSSDLDELENRMKSLNDLDELEDRMKSLNDLDELRNRMERLNLQNQRNHLVETKEMEDVTKDMEIMKDSVSDTSKRTSQLSHVENLKADVASPNKHQLSSVENFKADVVSPNKSFNAESSVIASIEIQHVENTTLQQQDLHNERDKILLPEWLEDGCAVSMMMDNGNLHGKGNKIVSLEEHLEGGYLTSTRMDNGYLTSTRMDSGSQASTSGRNDLKSDCAPITLSDFHGPLETLISPSNQETSQLNMSQSQDATGTSQKKSRGKGRSRGPRGKIDMSQPHDATGMSQKRPKGNGRPLGKGPKLKEPMSNTKQSTPKKKKDNRDKREQQDWELLRRMYASARERSNDHMDSVDWEAVRCAEIGDIAEAIKDRGQHNIIAGRIKDFLNRLVDFHNCIDLEWLRNAPPDLVKEYLLEIQGLGLKSVECIRLLSLQQIAFPVDVNVGRIAVRLGWVPLQPLPGDLHIHLLEQYPVMDSIQKYLWPRLCCLDQRTLYELHYQMITFGKVFCTKLNPNCAACPMRGECKHFASAFASARLALPGPSQQGIVKSEFGNLPSVVNPIPVIRIEADPISESGFQINNSEPIVELPPSPRPLYTESPEPDPEYFSIPDPEDFGIADIEDIPTIRLQEREFKENVQSFMEMNKIKFQDSRDLVVLTAEAASIPSRKLKIYSNLRTEHLVYVLPQNHELLREFERLEPEDPYPYLLAIWSSGETPNSYEPPKNKCDLEHGKLCNDHTCYSCNNIREQGADIVRGTILIPCRTANRGRFPLNGTYFQLNEVFADHETSFHPINVPRNAIANLPTQIAYFGTSTSSIFKGLDLPTIQRSFNKGFICVRGFDRRYRAPRPLSKRFHCSPSKMEKKKKTE